MKGKRGKKRVYMYRDCICRVKAKRQRIKEQVGNEWRKREREKKKITTVKRVCTYEVSH